MLEEYPKNMKEDKVSIKKKRAPRSAETRKKIGDGNRGKKKHYTAESYARLIASRKGRTAWNKGKKLGYAVWNKGMKMSDSYKKKLSLAHTTTGSTQEWKRVRSSVAFKDWRKAVFERDDYTCLSCRQKGGRLHPHHVYSFTRYPGLRFDVDNGATLCEACHKNFHKIYGYKHFRGEEIILILNHHKAYEPTNM